MKLSKIIKNSSIRKQAMPHWDEGVIRLKFHSGDVNELICKVHVEDNKKQVGTIILENQGKRVIQPDFKHKDMNDILDFLKEKRNEIEDAFGKILYDLGFIKGFHFVKNGFLQLDLTTSKRKTPVVDIGKTEDFKHYKELIDSLPTKAWKFNRNYGLDFEGIRTEWYEITWSELLFHN